MKKLVGLFIATLGVIAIASCDKEPDPSLVIGVDADVVVESPSASYTFTFTTNQAWTAESDSDWLTLETTSGQAGEIALVAAYTANNTNDYRYAKVSISAGSLKEEYTLAQKPVVKASEDKRISKAAQDISIPVNKDADAVVVALESEWLTKNDAASTNTALVLSATANESAFAREVVVTVTNNGKITTYTVRQSGNSIDLTLTKLVYLGRKQFIYNSSSWTYNHFDEFAFVCVSEDNKEVVLTVNAEEIEGEVKAVPNSTYTFDAGSLHTPGTFTANSKDDYYTHSEDLSGIFDGEIVIEVVDGVYSVLATLNESETVGKTYSFIGPIETIVDESYGAQVYSVAYGGQYYTYFTPDQAKRWNADLFISKNNDASIPYITWISMALYGEKDLDNLTMPTGTFSIIDAYSVPTIESPYANGITNFQPHTVSVSSNDVDGNTANFTPGGTITITKQDNGKYTIAFDAECKIYYRDDSWAIVDSAIFDYKPIIEDVFLPEVVSGNASEPFPDELAGGTMGTPMSNYFTSYYLGQPAGFNDCHVFYAGFTNAGNYNVQFSLAVASDDYEFVPRGTTGTQVNQSRVSFIPEGTYTFSSTVEGGKIIPTNYGYVQNTYTGTKFYITGGTVTLTGKTYAGDGTIDMQFTATPGSIDAETHVLTPSGAAISVNASFPTKINQVTRRTNVPVLFTLPAE
ncbi:MAG: BACON domain-containing protein [Bacteroidales bacterium]|nr:BACON domain-containing protein [Bacteroidales bacterium]